MISGRCWGSNNQRAEDDAVPLTGFQIQRGVAESDEMWVQKMQLLLYILAMIGTAARRASMVADWRIR